MVKEKVLLYLPATTRLTRLKLDLAVSTDLKAVEQVSSHALLHSESSRDSPS
jgi:hypothetical protein